MLGDGAIKGPTSLIVEATGTYKNCTFTTIVTCTGTDNGVHFKGQAQEVLEEFKIQVHKSTVYRPQANGAVEAANKTIKTILEKTTESIRNWHEQLPLAL